MFLDMISSKRGKNYKVVKPTSYLYSGGSIMTNMLIIAMYMGFEEIYLIGVDFTSAFAKDGHFLKDYTSDRFQRKNMKRAAQKLKKSIITEEEATNYINNIILNAYEKIEKYAVKHNIKIYNSTRGGALEVFERKSLEDVLVKRNVK